MATNLSVKVESAPTENEHETNVDEVGTEVPPTTKVLSWNIYGSGRAAKVRKELVPQVIKTVDPDILLLQETKVDLIGSIKNRKYKKVQAGDKKESHVLYDSDLYEDVSEEKIFPTQEKTISVKEALKVSIEKMISEAKELRHGQASRIRTAFTNRLSCVGLKRKGQESHPENVTVFMSFHNFSKKSEQIYKAAIYFCKIVSVIQEQTGALVMVGANLNCDMDTIERTKTFKDFILKEQKRVRDMVMQMVVHYRMTVWQIQKERPKRDYILLHGPRDRMHVDNEAEALDFMTAQDDHDNPLYDTMTGTKQILTMGEREGKENLKKFRKAVEHDPIIKVI